MPETENKKRRTYGAFIITAAVFLVAGALLGFALAGKFTAGSEGVQSDTIEKSLVVNT